jgi:hypothetical protein
MQCKCNRQGDGEMEATKTTGYEDLERTELWLN